MYVSRRGREEEREGAREEGREGGREEEKEGGEKESEGGRYGVTNPKWHKSN